MNRKDVEAVAHWLRGHGVDFVVVGGSAIERNVPVGTEDIDLLIAVGAWGAVEEAVATTKAATPLDPSSGTIRGTLLPVGARRVDVEFIAGGPFGGQRGGDAFLRYVRHTRSTESRGIRFADPPVVWYMRLAIDDWEPYVFKILRDARAGVPVSTLEGVLEIARRFGVRSKLRPRVELARRALRLVRRDDAHPP